VSSKKQQRKAVERAKYQAYLERKATQRRRRRSNQIIIGSVVTVAILVGAALWGSGTFTDEAPAAEPAPTASPTPTPKTTPKPTPKSTTPTYDKARQVLTAGKPATATLKTNHGDITIDLDTKNAPNNSNSIAFLAEKGYFDRTSCHRLTTSGLYVLQCGDPTGTGTGGPGYTTADENLPKDGENDYPAGTVAMAEPPGQDAGSQFFLVYKDTTLPANYTILGQIAKGLDIVSQIAKDGTADGSQDGPPKTPITIKSVDINQA